MSASAAQQMVAAIQRGDNLSSKQQQEAIRLLTDFECWMPLFRLLDDIIENDPDNALDTFLHKIKIEIDYRDDHKRVAQLAREVVKRFGIDFTYFRLKILATMEGSWQLEADVLKMVCMEFKVEADRVKCLERLCALYEKKIPDDQLQQKYYNDLIKIDPKNIRALKHFKMMYSQNFEWELVTDALCKIMRWGNISDTYRAAQELAAVHLYSKNDPRGALRIMKKHCSDSPLDKSTILYEIYARLGDHSECVALLKKKLALARQPSAQARLHIRIAALEEKRDRIKAALREYKLAFEKDSSQVEAVQRIISICLWRDDWQEALAWLQKLESRATGSELGERLRRIRNTIEKHMVTRASA